MSKEIVKKNPLEGEVEKKLKSEHLDEARKNIDFKKEEKELGKIMLSNKFTSEQKDAYLSNYLFKKGLESASFLVELFLSKGHLTKETREFKSIMRKDFEDFFEEMSKFFLMFSEIIIDKKKINEIKSKINNKVKLPELKKDFDKLDLLGYAFYEFAKKILDELEFLRKEREKEKGYGIFIDSKGKVYSIFDKDFDEAIKREKKKEEK